MSKHYFGSNVKTCCKKMHDLLEDDRFPIDMNPILRKYMIPFAWPYSVLYQIDYCPWCGSQLRSLDEEYKRILKDEYGIEEVAFDYSNVPDEFKSEKWWIKRNL